MSIQIALNFIHYARHDEAGRKQIHSLNDSSTLDKVVMFGQQAGFYFTVIDLRDAFKLDWEMRANYYSSTDA